MLSVICTTGNAVMLISSKMFLPPTILLPIREKPCMMRNCKREHQSLGSLVQRIDERCLRMLIYLILSHMVEYDDETKQNLLGLISPI